MRRMLVGVKLGAVILNKLAHLKVIKIGEFFIRLNYIRPDSFNSNFTISFLFTSFPSTPL